MAYDIIRRRQVDGNWTMGAPIFTTSEDALQKWTSLRAAVDNLNNDITQFWFPKAKNEPGAASFVNQWITWRDNVYSDYKENTRRKIIPDLAWNVWNRGDAKLKELEEWRARFEKRSGQATTAPGTTPEETHGPKKPSGGFNPWLLATMALAGAVGLTILQRKID